MCYVSFHKRPDNYGYTEMESLKKLGAVILNRAPGHPGLDKSIDAVKNANQVVAAIEEIKIFISAHHFDLLILDEILISVRDKFVEEQIIIDFIESKPSSMELVLTGRGATKRMIDAADYVSYIKKLKHPFDVGIVARKGIEF